MRITAISVLLCLLACLPACRKHEDAAPADSARQQKNGAAPEPASGPVKQLILLYTGDTLSIPEANDDYHPPQGGLGALVKAITDYEGQILYYNQQRVENEGGDPTQIRADFERGMIGDNPFVLLDYGLWERPNDASGDMFVKLYLDMFSQLHYTAIGCALYLKLTPERRQQYARILPAQTSLLLSAGELPDAAWPTVNCVTRELYGKRWGVAAIPIPVIAPGAPQEMVKQALAQLNNSADAAYAALRAKGCNYSILLAPSGPKEFYAEVAQSKRFTVVIGGHPASSSSVGRYAMPAGALVLPALNGGGRELGICHLSITAGGDKPYQYYFTRQACTDDGSAVYPYRRQVQAAVARHAAAVAQRKAKTAH
jgi:hypothetical protein